eukprot:5802278-Heterocapsa_arctica.AAC.1
MVYRWKWDHTKTKQEIARYGRDGCTRWYPDVFLEDSDAKMERSHDFMIGLMADDIEDTPGYD